MDELNLPFRLEPLAWSSYAVANLAFLAVASGWIVGLVWRDRRSAARPAFMVAGLLSLLFQWPVWIYSGVLERSLATHWLFALHLHAMTLGLLAWTTFTPAFTGRLRLERDAHGEGLFSIVATVCVLVLGGVLVFLYLQRVGISCTGLAATVLDPEVALLARELSIKMAGGGWPTFAHALVVSVVSPVAVFLALQHAIAAMEQRRLWPVLGNAALITFFFFAVLLPGAKGNLMPTLVASALGLCFHAKGWLRRGLHVALVAAVGMTALVAVELVKEKRYFQDESQYPFAQCVERLDICVPMRGLLNSMSSRDYALGISAATIDWFQSELEQRCMGALPPRVPFSFEVAPEQQRLIRQRRRILEEKYAVAIRHGREMAQAHAGASRAGAPASAPAATETPAASVPGQAQPVARAQAIVDGTDAGRVVAQPQPIGETLPQRAWAYVEAIAYRAWVVPLQVAAWHYDYVTRVERPGAAVLPTARWTHSKRVTDMPTRIHDHYAPGYSAGAKVTTGTAPSSFLVSYSAPMGTRGMLLALVCVIAFDALVSWVIGRAFAPLKPLGIALMAVAALNLMLTDFETTMLSHGAIASLMLLFGLDVAYRLTRRYLEVRRGGLPDRRGAQANG
ncbi:hypothetical protein [Ramlibacter humi]|uniref:Uncharacterized protein n=1 Tax=Ramlibacter humi TaxID=2530451 RepID=A0A4Z0C0R8_9BURK|nr:hypothetical protein [Ramlibacter humi]TFZ03835.1 hypothetical protein EZ216_09290 [Ramlibacter humi]